MSLTDFIVIGEFAGPSASVSRLQLTSCLFNIRVSYPNGTTFNYCKGRARNLGRPPEFLGRGRINVTIRDSLLGYVVNNFKERRSDLQTGISGRKISSNTKGIITFTAYKKCPNPNLSKELRSCSNVTNNKCIKARLFCNGDFNCGPSISDYCITGNEESLKIGFDEKETCRFWKYTKTVVKLERKDSTSTWMDIALAIFSAICIIGFFIKFIYKSGASDGVGSPTQADV